MALSSTCIYGQSGVGKTGLIGMIVKWFGLKAKLATCENADTIKPQIDDGTIKAWRIDNRNEPFHVTNMAIEGFWPKDTNDPESELIAPSAEDFIEYPIRIFEGLATYADYLMGSYAEGGLADRMGRGQKSGPGTRPGDDAVAFMQSGTPVGGNSQSHYNAVQKQMHSRVVKSHRLPCHIIWTSHEIKASKNEFGQPLANFGPEVVGMAATPKVPRWFGHLLHVCITEKVKKDALREGDHHIYLKEHYDPAIPNIPFKAQLRVPIEQSDSIPLFINFNEEEVFKALPLIYNKES